MKERLRIQKKVSTQPTYNPAINPFQTRSFGIELQKKKSSSPTEDVDFDAQYEHAKRFALDLSHVPVYAPGKAAPPPIQTKLTIGQPGDKYEQEADNVAAQMVQRINDPAVEQSSQGQSVQRETLPEEEGAVQLSRILDPNSQECQELLQTIRNIISDIQKRIGELHENIGTLPETHPDDNKQPRLSKRGHRGIINRLKKILAKHKAVYVSKCGQLPDDVRESEDPNNNWFQLPNIQLPNPLEWIPPIPSLNPFPSHGY